MIVPFLLFFFFSSVNGICPTGSVVNSFSNKWKCLVFVSPKKLFLTAEEYCSDNYKGHLVSIDNAFANLFIAQTADSSFVNTNSSRYWIGVDNIDGTGWKSIDDGSSAVYTHWASGETTNSSGSNGCVSVDLTGLWYNSNCFVNYPFVCEVPEV